MTTNKTEIYELGQYKETKEQYYNRFNKFPKKIRRELEQAKEITKAFFERFPTAYSNYSGDGLVLTELTHLTQDDCPLINALLTARPSIVGLGLDSSSTDFLSLVDDQLKLRFVYLSADSCPLIDTSVVAQFRNLMSLEISKCRIGDQGAKNISTLTELAELNVSSNNISDQGIAFLMKNPTIKVLGVEDNLEISSQGAQLLANNPHLTVLKIDAENLGWDGLEPFSSNVTLTCFGREGFHENFWVHIFQPFRVPITDLDPLLKNTCGESRDNTVIFSKNSSSAIQFLQHLFIENMGLQINYKDELLVLLSTHVSQNLTPIIWDYVPYLEKGHLAHMRSRRETYSLLKQQDIAYVTERHNLIVQKTRCTYRAIFVAESPWWSLQKPLNFQTLAEIEQSPDEKLQRAFKLNLKRPGYARISKQEDEVIIFGHQKDFITKKIFGFFKDEVPEKMKTAILKELEDYPEADLDWAKECGVSRQVMVKG